MGPELDPRGAAGAGNQSRRQQRDIFAKSERWYTSAEPVIVKDGAGIESVCAKALQIINIPATGIKIFLIIVLVLSFNVVQQL